MTDSLFIKAYELYRNNVYAAAFSLVRNAADAADLQQETFMRLYTCDREFENDTHMKAWLLRVVVNLSKNHLRDNRRIVLTELTETILLRMEPDSRMFSMPYLLCLKNTAPRSICITMRIIRCGNRRDTIENALYSSWREPVYFVANYCMLLLADSVRFIIPLTRLQQWSCRGKRNKNQAH